MQQSPAPIVSPPNKRARAVILGAVYGTGIGVVATFASACALPTPSGPNAVAGAMLIPAIHFLLAMTVGACFVSGIIGAVLRPFMLSIGAAVLPLIAAVASVGSDEPLIREMVPYAAVGVAIAAIVGGAIRSRIERQ